MSEEYKKPAELEAGVYWYLVPGQKPVICEKREGEDHVRFMNGSFQRWAR